MTRSKKIKTIEELAEILNKARAPEKKIVHCHGVFDLLHIGHIRYFQQAREAGDVLVVTVTPDRFVDKGPHRPAFTEALRAEAVASLDIVDFVAINKWPTAEETLRILKPDIYMKGSEFKDTSSDMTGKIAREEQVVREIGASLAFAEDIVFSSSNLINRYLHQLPDELENYLTFFRSRYQMDDILGALDGMSGIKALVIGDTILDEYQYCSAIGKSSKDPILALKYQSHDLFAGGALAVANHVANFADSVKLVTVLGDRDSHEDFIRERLRENVSPHFAIHADAPTLIKRRFIDGYTFNKLFEVYVMRDGNIAPDVEAQLCDWLRQHLSEYDIVIAADFGHGTITPEMIRVLAEHSKFLAVNTQANAGNRGFNTLSRYPRADFACIADHEIRLEMRDLTSDIPPLMDTLAGKIQSPYFVVTCGRRGCFVRNGGGEFVEVPSFASSVVDRVGAGDAFFAVAALAAVQNSPGEIIGFIGNVAASQAVETLGNKKPVDKLSMKKHIASLMK